MQPLDECNTALPVYPDVDISLLQSGPFVTGPTGPSYTSTDFGIPNDQKNQTVDITMLPGVPNQIPPVAFKWTQSSNSASWVITHNLNFFPNVTVFDSSTTSWQIGNELEGDVQHIDKKTLHILFSRPVKGTAILS
jgi:hypothetical protein